MICLDFVFCVYWHMAVCHSDLFLHTSHMTVFLCPAVQNGCLHSKCLFCLSSSSLHQDTLTWESRPCRHFDDRLIWVLRMLVMWNTPNCYTWNNKSCVWDTSVEKIILVFYFLFAPFLKRGRGGDMIFRFYVKITDHFRKSFRYVLYMFLPLIILQPQ